jgi:uncharacterized protein GlcG (DUF336 family)
MASLTLAEAEQILAVAKAKVMAMGANMSISVVDPRGDLLTMCRTDGASWRTPPISRAKAVAAACFGRASGELTENALSPVFRGLMAMEGGHMIPGQGAFLSTGTASLSALWAAVVVPLSRMRMPPGQGSTPLACRLRLEPSAAGGFGRFQGPAGCAPDNG